jgi:hypothetical protein
MQNYKHNKGHTIHNEYQQLQRLHTKLIDTIPKLHGSDYILRNVIILQMIITFYQIDTKMRILMQRT